MLEIAFLVYVPDPFAVLESRFMVRRKNVGDRVVTAAELVDVNCPLLTIDLSALIDDLRRLRRPPPPKLLDFGEAVRLGVGLSKDDGGEKSWNIWPILARHFENPQDAEGYRLTMLARIERPPLDELTRLLSAALDALEGAWTELAAHLQKLGELDRLTQVEWPLQSLFAYRQYRGIRIDADYAAPLLSKIAAEKYQAFRVVAETIKKSPSGLSFRTIGAHLYSTDVSHLSDVDPTRMQDAFELAGEASPFAAAFLALVKASRDELVVRRALGGDERLYPVFTVHGTVSGRILVSDPFLQQLRRRYRSLIAPDVNRRLAYLDYAQFEPGILAGLSNDDALISAYNEGDLYTALAQRLFNDPAKRPVAKRVFLAFSYGMAPERIALMLSAKHTSAPERDEIAASITEFFAKFPGLREFRKRQEEALQRDGMVSSTFGNRRVRHKAGRLSHKERRWALNQPIQSTASLIFKEALSRLEERFDADAILLPMHDAALLQLPDGEGFHRDVEDASRIMIDAFRSRFPRVSARVTSGSFAGD